MVQLLFKLVHGSRSLHGPVINYSWLSSHNNIETEGLYLTFYKHLSNSLHIVTYVEEASKTLEFQ